MFSPYSIPNDADISELYDLYAPSLFSVILHYEPDIDEAGTLLTGLFRNLPNLSSSYIPSQNRIFTWLFKQCIVTLQKAYPGIYIDPAAILHRTLTPPAAPVSMVVV